MWLKNNFWRDRFAHFSKTEEKQEKMTHRFEGSCNTNILKWKLYRKINSIRTSHQTFVLMKTSWRRISSPSSEDVLKTSWRRLGKICLRRFNMFKLFLLTSLRDVVNTLLRRTAKTVIYRRICVVHTSEKLTVSVQNLQVR